MKKRLYFGVFCRNMGIEWAFNKIHVNVCG